MYTPESLEMRAGLLSDPIVLQALDDLWQAANTDTTTDAEGEDFIDKVEYLEMHRRMVLSLQPTVTPAEAAEHGFKVVGEDTAELLVFFPALDPYSTEHTHYLEGARPASTQQ